MSSRYSFIKILIAFIFLLAFYSCKENTIEPTLTGSITGTVLQSSDSHAVSGASITTSPPTSAIVTSSSGKFSFSDIPVGDYTISVSKSGFIKTTVSVSVTENSTTEATIFLAKDTSSNQPPNLPADPSPVNTADNLPVSLTLAWSATDPDLGDSLIFDVYLYKSNSTVQNKIASNYADTSLEVTDLDYYTTYFWQVVAKDTAGKSTNGNIWSFKTKAFPNYPIVYSSNQDGNYEIYSISDTSSENPIRLTNNNYKDWWPRISPRKNKIAYITDQLGDMQIYTMNTDGSNNYRVTTIPISGMNNNGIGFAWSPDAGKFIYPNNDKIYSINVNGSGLTTIATAPANRNFRECEYSPQGDKIAALTIGSNIYDSEIYLMNTNGTNMTLLVDNQPGITASPSFSINGEQVLYTHDVSGYQSQSGRQLNAHIFIINTDNSDTVDVSFDKPDGTNDLYPRFSPDGSKIIFSNGTNDGNSPLNLWIMDSNGENRTKLTDNGIMPDWK